jgi:membrane glycosyltransferase
MSLAPKLAGILGVLLAKGDAARYGGAVRLLAGAAVEILFSSMLSVIMAWSGAFGQGRASKIERKMGVTSH